MTDTEKRALSILENLLSEEISSLLWDDIDDLDIEATAKMFFGRLKEIGLTIVSSMQEHPCHCLGTEQP